MLLTTNLTQASPISEIFLHNGGIKQVEATGTFGTASVRMETSQDELDFVVLSNFDMTAADVLRVNMLPGTSYRFSLASPDGSTDIQVSVL